MEPLGAPPGLQVTLAAGYGADRVGVYLPPPGQVGDLLDELSSGRLRVPRPVRQEFKHGDLERAKLGASHSGPAREAHLRRGSRGTARDAQLVPGRDLCRQAKRPCGGVPRRADAGSVPGGLGDLVPTRSASGRVRPNRVGRALK